MRYDTLEILSGCFVILCIPAGLALLGSEYAAAAGGILFVGVFNCFLTFAFYRANIREQKTAIRIETLEGLTRSRGQIIEEMSKRLAEATTKRVRSIEPGDEVLVRRGSGKTYRGVCLDDKSAYIPATGNIEQGTLWKADIIDEADIMFEFNKDTLTAKIQQAVTATEEA